MDRKPLAFAKWQYPYTLTPEQEARKEILDRIEGLEHPLPEGANRELYNVFFTALRAKKAKWMDESKDYCKSESDITDRSRRTPASWGSIHEETASKYAIFALGKIFDYSTTCPRMLLIPSVFTAFY